MVDYFDVQMLLCDMYDIPDCDYEKTDFDQLVFDKFEIGFEQLSNVIDALIPYTQEQQVLLTKKKYKGFVKDNMFLIKKEVNG